MDLGQLRTLLVRWAGRQALIRRVHVVGARARGLQPADSRLELVIELDSRADPAEDTQAMAGWQRQLDSAVPMAVTLRVFSAGEDQPLREALRVANICIYERCDRGLVQIS